MDIEPSACADCGVDTTPCTGRRGCRHAGKWEYYMVRPEVWSKSGLTAGFLCVGCLETRLGRELQAVDFTDAPVNDPTPWDTPRLAVRRRQRRLVRYRATELFPIGRRH